jgi:hypothetical protein
MTTSDLPDISTDIEEPASLAVFGMRQAVALSSAGRVEGPGPERPAHALRRERQLARGDAEARNDLSHF